MICDNMNKKTKQNPNAIKFNQVNEWVTRVPSWRQDPTHTDLPEGLSRNRTHFDQGEIHGDQRIHFDLRKSLRGDRVPYKVVKRNDRYQSQT